MTAHAIPSLRERALAAYADDRVTIERMDRENDEDTRREITQMIKMILGENVAPEAITRGPDGGYRITLEPVTTIEEQDGITLRWQAGHMAIAGRRCPECGTRELVEIPAADALLVIGEVLATRDQPGERCGRCLAGEYPQARMLRELELIRRNVESLVSLSRQK